MDTERRTTVIDLLRHGKCEGGEIYRGTTDVALSEEGWQQMNRAVGTAEHFPWDHIVSSPLKRCLEFSRSVSATSGAQVSVVKGLREMHFGEWEGRTMADVWENDAGRVKAFAQDPILNSPPEGESLVDALDRVCQAWKEILEQHKGQHILLVQHGGTMRLLLAHFLNLPLPSVLRIDVPYAALSRIKIYHSNLGDRPVLEFHNGRMDSALDV